MHGTGMHSRGARLARGWVAGAIATAVAALSHALAGGGTPGWLAILAGVVFAGLLGTVATGRRPSLARLSIAVAGGQLAFHVAFSLLGTSAAGSALPSGHQHGALVPMPPMAPMTPMAETAAHHADGALMWGAHALAAVATILFLRYAERALWSLLTAAVHVLLGVLRPVPAVLVAGARRLPALVDAPARGAHRILSSSVSRRGPPPAAAH